MAEAKPDHINQSEEKPTSGNHSEGNQNSSNQLPLPNIEGLKILGLLGQGGMAVVYKAEHLSLRRIAAVKMLPTSALGESGIKRFQSEAKKLANLSHPNIVKVYSCGLSKDGVPYIEMELLEGKTLSHYLSSNELSTEQFCNIIIDVLKALQCAHDAGLVHRDIKPANIIIQKHDNVYSGKLLDFGIAKSLTHSQQRLTQSGDLIGTPAYMSPEQCKGEELSERSDLYSIACILYEYFMGKAPYAGDNPLERMYKHINEAVPDLSSMKTKCGEALAALIHKSLAKEPQERQASAALMQAELEEALHTIPSPDENQFAKTRKLIIAVTASVLLVITIVGFLTELNLLNRKPSAVKTELTAESKDINDALVKLRKALTKIDSGIQYRYKEPKSMLQHADAARDLILETRKHKAKKCSEEVWLCHALAGAIADESGRINQACGSNDSIVILRQSESEWKHALKVGNVYWQTHSSLPYGISFLGYMRALLAQGKTAEAEEICKKEIDQLKKYEPDCRALPLMQRAICEIHLSKGEKTLANEETKKLLEMNEKIPCIENEKFSNLLLLAKSSPADERKQILDQAMRMHLTFKELEDADESADAYFALGQRLPGSLQALTNLFFPTWNEREKKSICHYNLALTFQELNEPAKAKRAIQLMKDADEEARTIRCCDPDYDPQKVADIEKL